MSVRLRLKKNAGPESRKLPKKRLRDNSRPNWIVLSRKWRPRSQYRKLRKTTVTNKAKRSRKKTKTRLKSNRSSIRRNLKIWFQGTN